MDYIHFINLNYYDYQIEIEDIMYSYGYNYSELDSVSYEILDQIYNDILNKID